ncbi:MAG: succinylglutamate desuccinylase/aspartoacylase family protein [Pirellulales bacterium]|nr:succinylglutamate desuccinylase/aspartoacylase family protein [Pirellulales bacterium]
MMLQQFTVSGRRPGPHLLITAGVHGDEFEPMVAVRALVEELRPSDVRGVVTLIPVVNEPAFSRGERTAEDQLDLARTCPGTAEGSVTQRLAAALTAAIRSADYYIDLHTGGARLRLMPLAGYMLHKDESVLEKQRAMAAAFNLPLVWGTSPVLEGRSLSVARDAGIPAIYAEHSGGGGYSFAAVDDYRQGCRNVMGLIDMLHAPVQSSRVKYCVEDRRPESGHLQVRHPAPAGGLFLPCVEVGQSVARGQTLGELLHPIEGARTAIVAECDGIVLMLHTWPRVAEGTGLAVVLELP